MLLNGSIIIPPGTTAANQRVCVSVIMVINDGFFEGREDIDISILVSDANFADLNVANTINTFEITDSEGNLHLCTCM